MILDTTAISALSFENKDLIKLLDANPRHHLPVIVIGEYQFGLMGSNRNRELQKWFDLVISESIVLPVDRETATHYATCRDKLKKAGKPVPANDLWIAALALQHQLPIVSCDIHFDHVAGIKRFNW